MITKNPVEIFRGFFTKRVKKVNPEIMSYTMANFQKYNYRGDRMAIFGEVVDNRLHLTIFRCSHKDQFCKRTAREAYNVNKEGWPHKYHPSTVVLDIEDNKPKATFQKYCHNNFYTKETLMIAIPDVVFQDKVWRIQDNLLQGKILTKNDWKQAKKTS